jgi:hypothetical protein
MIYDETLLAVIGIPVKHESSIAGWMRHGGPGLLNIEAAEHASQLRTNPDGSPLKKRRLNQTDSFPGTGHLPSSPTTLLPSLSQSHHPSMDV